MKGIAFSGPMVRAILDGRKTVTRRIMKPQPKIEEWQGEKFICQKAPYRPGEVAYVKETWMGTKDCLSYKASDPRQIIEFNKDKWRPPRFMPAWASRLHLEIVSVRPERIQEITEDEARLEGTIDGGCLSCGESERKCACDNPRPDARDAFVYLWHTLHPGSWDRNDYVWRIEFKGTT